MGNVAPFYASYDSLSSKVNEKTWALVNCHITRAVKAFPLRMLTNAI